MNKSFAVTGLIDFGRTSQDAYALEFVLGNRRCGFAEELPWSDFLPATSKIWSSDWNGADQSAVLQRPPPKPLVLQAKTLINIDLHPRGFNVGPPLCLACANSLKSDEVLFLTHDLFFKFHSFCVYRRLSHNLPIHGEWTFEERYPRWDVINLENTHCTGLCCSSFWVLLFIAVGTFCDPLLADLADANNHAKWCLIFRQK